MKNRDAEILKLKKALAKKESELRAAKEKLEQREHDIRHLDKKLHDAWDIIDIVVKADKLLAQIIETYAPGEMYTKYKEIRDPAERLMHFVMSCKTLLLQNLKLKKYLFGQCTGNPKNKNEGQKDGNEEKPNEANGADQGGEGEGASAGESLVAQALAKAGTTEATKKALLLLGSRVIDLISNKDTQDKLVKALKGRAKDSKAHDEESGKKPSGGKKKSSSNLRHFANRSELERLFQRRLTGAQAEFLKQWVCPQCGTAGDYSLKKMVITMLDSFASAGLIKGEDNGSFTVTEEHSNVVCNHCGYSEPAKEDNPPVLPGHKTSLSLAVTAAINFGSGFPITAFENSYLAGAGLGHTTLLESVHTLAMLLYPLYAYAGATVDEAPAVGTDETTFNTSIKGVTKREYMCAKVTQPGVWPPAAYFYPPDSRSKVKEVVDGLKGQVLTSDAYAAYERFGGTHQLCAAHLAVKIYEVCEGRHSRAMLNLAKRLESRGKEGLRDLDLSKTDDAIYALAVIYLKLKYIFAFETKAAADFEPQDGAKLYAKRQSLRGEYEREIMQDIETIFNELVKHYAVISGTDKNTNRPLYKAKDKLNPICEPVVYWANSCGAFKSFLDEPKAAFDNLDCERIMRLISKVRNSSQTLRSKEGGEALSIIVSCMHTATMSGVKSLAAYLFEVTREVQYLGARQISLAWFNQYQQELRQNPEAKASRRNYNQPDVYRQIKLPEWLKPHVWAARHEKARNQTAGDPPVPEA